MHRSLLLSAALLAGPALADDLSYNFFDLGYQTVGIDSSTLDVDGDGFGLTASVAIAPDFHLFADYGEAEFDLLFDTRTDVSELAAGVGYNKAISDDMDLVVQAGFLRADSKSTFGGSGSPFYSPSSISNDDTGYLASVGLRGMASDKLELSGTLTHVDIFNSTDLGLGVSAVYYPAINWGVGLSYGLADDEATFAFGLRFNFNRN